MGESLPDPSWLDRQSWLATRPGGYKVKVVTLALAEKELREADERYGRLVERLQRQVQVADREAVERCVAIFREWCDEHDYAMTFDLMDRLRAVSFTTDPEPQPIVRFRITCQDGDTGEITYIDINDEEANRG